MAETQTAESPLRANLEAMLREARAGEPTRVVDNERHYVVRAKHGLLPVSLPMSMALRGIARVPGVVVTKPAEGAPEIRAKGDGEGEVEDPAATVQLQGTASSTSEDWYGTDMSPECLTSMAEQMNRGVSLFPRHGGWLDRVEWNDEIGVTTAAEISRAEVAAPVEGTDPKEQFVLKMTADLWVGASELAEELANRLETKAAMEAAGKPGQRIGLSIGGWFLEMLYVTDGDGNLIRVTVLNVELDHVAVVRSPANPDSDDLQLMRSTWGAARALPAPVVAPEPAAAVRTAPVVEPVAKPSEAAPVAVEPAQAAVRTTGEADATLSAENNGASVTEATIVDPAVRTSENPTHEGGASDRSEAPMTDEEKAAQDQRMREMIQTELRSIVPTIVTELRAVAPTTTTTTTEEIPAVREYRERAEKAEREVAANRRALAAQASVGFRSGRGTQDLSSNSDEVPHEIRSVIEVARSKGEATTLSAVIERNVERLAVNFRDTSDAGFQKVQRAKMDARDLLGTLFRAAEADGLVRNPFEGVALPQW